MPWLLAGCLVPDPEKFPEPERTAIEVDTNEISPALNQILTVTPPQVREFNIRYRSVDLGDPPAAYVYLDYDTPQEALIGQDALQTPSNEGTPRDFRVLARFDTPCVRNDSPPVACCHRVTLIAMHESSVMLTDAGIWRPDPIRSRGDQTRVIWWVAANPQGANPDRLANCPAGTSSP